MGSRKWSRHTRGAGEHCGVSALGLVCGWVSRAGEASAFGSFLESS